MTVYNEFLHVPERATILDVKTLSATEKLFRIALDSGKDLGHTPGQFLTLSLPLVGMASISITSSPTDHGWFELGVRAIPGGNVTPALHAKKPGDKVFVSKPRGNGFPIDELSGKDLILVAGGIGLFPLRSLIRYVLAKRDDFGRVSILFGATHPSVRLLPQEIEEWKANTQAEYLESVDNGDETWTGHVGYAASLIPLLSDVNAEKTRAVVIGPDRMFSSVSIQLGRLGVKSNTIYASVERMMSCGVGHCRNCLLPDGKLACQETVQADYYSR